MLWGGIASENITGVLEVVCSTTLDIRMSMLFISISLLQNAKESRLFSACYCYIRKIYRNENSLAL